MSARPRIYDAISPRTFRIYDDDRTPSLDGGDGDQDESRMPAGNPEVVQEGPVCYDGECRHTFEAAKPGWKAIPAGGLNPEAGNGARYHTGSWRIRKPLYRNSKCIQCFQCWVSCPDVAIVVTEKKVRGIDLYHCKGCGICAQVCPTDAIMLIDEEEDWGTETYTQVGPGDVINKADISPGHPDQERAWPYKKERVKGGVENKGAPQ